jgi:hypothetical protein
MDANTEISRVAIVGIKPQYLKCVQTTRSYGPERRRLNI